MCVASFRIMVDKQLLKVTNNSSIGANLLIYTFLFNLQMTQSFTEICISYFLNLW